MENRENISFPTDQDGLIVTSQVISGELQPHHQDHLYGEGFGSACIKIMREMGVKSITQEQARIMGFVVKGSDGKYHSGSGIYFPFSSEFGQLRLDNPITRNNGQIAKYLTPCGKTAVAYIPPGCKVISEGFKDGMAGTLIGQIITGFIAGVTHYRKLPKGCGVTIIYDNDAWTNPNVMYNLIRAGQWVNGKINIIPPIPGKPKAGLCEYFQAGYTAKDYSILVACAYTPKDAIFQWASHFGEIAQKHLSNALRKISKLAAELFDEIEQHQLVQQLQKATRLGIATLKKWLAAANANLRKKALEVGSQVWEEYRKQRWCFQCESLGLDYQNLVNGITFEQHIYQKLTAEGDWCVLDSAFYKYNQKGGWVYVEDPEVHQKISIWSESAFRIEKDFAQFGFTTNRYTESAYGYCRKRSLTYQPAQSKSLIAFNNTTVDTATNQLLPHSRDHLITRWIPYDYVPTDQCPEVFKQWAIDTFGIELLEHLRAYISGFLDPSAPYGWFVHFIGASGSGKGTTMRFLNKLFGPQGYKSGASFSVFATAEGRHQHLSGCYFYSLPDIGGFMNNTKVFYEMVDNGPMSGRPLFQSYAYQKQWNVRFAIGSVNHLQIENLGDGWKRRCRQMPTKTRTAKTDPQLEAKLESCIGEVIGWALSMPREERDAILLGEVSTPTLEAVKEEAAMYSDSLRNFIDRGLRPSRGQTLSVATMHSMYVAYCKEHGYQAMGMSKASSHLKNIIPQNFQPRRWSSMTDGHRQMIPAHWLHLEPVPEAFKNVAVNEDGGQTDSEPVWVCQKSKCSEGGLEAIALFWNEPPNPDDPPPGGLPSDPKGPSSSGPPPIPDVPAKVLTTSQNTNLENAQSQSQSGCTGCTGSALVDQGGSKTLKPSHSAGVQGVQGTFQDLSEKKPKNFVGFENFSNTQVAVQTHTLIQMPQTQSQSGCTGCTGSGCTGSGCTGSGCTGCTGCTEFTGSKWPANLLLNAGFVNGDEIDEPLVEGLELSIVADEWLYQLQPVRQRELLVDPHGHLWSRQTTEVSQEYGLVKIALFLQGESSSDNNGGTAVPPKPPKPKTPLPSTEDSLSKGAGTPEQGAPSQQKISLVESKEKIALPDADSAEVLPCSQHQETATPMPAVVVLDPQTSDYQQHLEAIASARIISVDCETFGENKNDGLHPWNGDIRLIQLCIGDITYIVDLGSRLQARSPVKEVQAQTLKVLAKAIANSQQRIVGHNIHFDLRFLATQLGIRNATNVACTMLGLKIFYGDYGGDSSNAVFKGGYSLENAAKRLLGITLDKTQQTSDWGAPLVDAQIEYAAADAAVTFKLYQALEQLYADKQNPLYSDRIREIWEVENQAIAPAIEIELTGMPVDLQLVQQQFRQIEGIKQQLLTQWQTLCPGATYTQRDKLLKFLNDRYQLGLTKLDKASCAQHKSNPLVQLRLELTALDALANNLKGFQRAASRDGRVHTIYKTLTGFGRFASGGGNKAPDLPNLQSISAKSNPTIAKHKPPKVREAIKPPPGRGMAVIDLAGAHGRIAADQTKDPVAIAGNNDDSIDNHSKVATYIAKAAGLDWTAEHIGKARKDKSHPDHTQAKLFRDTAKNTYYGFLNGAGAQRIQQQIAANTGKTPELAACEAAIDGCKQLYPKVLAHRYNLMKYLKRTAIKVDGQMVAVNQLSDGARILLPLVPSKRNPGQLDVPFTQALACIWTRIEATAVKRALPKIMKLSKAHPQWQLRVTNYVHDEVDIEFDNQFAQEAVTAVNDIIGEEFQAQLKLVKDGRETDWQKLLVQSWADK